MPLSGRRLFCLIWLGQRLRLHKWKQIITATALELLNMLEKYPTKGLKGADEESTKTYDAIKKLREVLKRTSRSKILVKQEYRDVPD